MSTASSIGQTSKYSISDYLLGGIRNYGEARKAYLNALRYDKENQNVLRDLGQLQVQLRDYEGYAETRRRILVVKSNLQ